MSFGDLLVLLLFVLFVILPSIQRAQRRGTGAPPPGPRPTAGPGGARPPASGVPGPAASRDDFPPLEEDELSRRLAEARERVRRAAGQAPSTAAPAPRPGGPATQDPRARAAAPLVRGQPKSSAPPVDPRARARAPLVAGDRDDGLLSTPLPPRPALTAARRPDPRGRAAAARDLRTEAPRIEVERLVERAGLARPAQALLRGDAGAIRDGLLWHQVLGAPRARRRLGGGPFPER